MYMLLYKRVPLLPFFLVVRESYTNREYANYTTLQANHSHGSIWQIIKTVVSLTHIFTLRQLSNYKSES